MGVRITHKGDFKNTERFFKGYKDLDVRKILSPFGEKGVSVLSSATPIDSGETKSSWDYRITQSRSSFSLIFINSHATNKGTPIVILLHYGHATRNGGYVQGRDFINPTIRPVFDELAEAAWKEVLKL
jgi:hypothetical protein